MFVQLVKSKMCIDGKVAVLRRGPPSLFIMVNSKKGFILFCPVLCVLLETSSKIL